MLAPNHPRGRRSIATALLTSAVALAVLTATGCTATATPEPGADHDATAALWEAIARDDVAGAQQTIDAGADLESRGEGDATPLIAATKAGRTEIALVLLDAGADPNAQDAIHDSAFLYAGAEGLDDILRATLAHGADVASTNRFGGTALIPASEHGHVSTVRILIDAGVPLDHVNDLGWTAIHEAIVLGDGSADQVTTVRLLLEAGADPTLADGEGTTPRELAARAGFDDIVALLDAAS